LVKNLVRQYVQEENTLILLATPMDSKIENATAAGIVIKAGAVDRCIGVLTKPYRLPVVKSLSEIRARVIQKIAVSEPSTASRSSDHLHTSIPPSQAQSSGKGESYAPRWRAG
jgi:hypothetical protein